MFPVIKMSLNGTPSPCKVAKAAQIPSCYQLTSQTLECGLRFSCGNLFYLKGFVNPSGQYDVRGERRTSALRFCLPTAT